MLDTILTNLVSFVVGFVGGVITAFGKGWVDEFFKKREERRRKIDVFMGKVIDLIAIATSNGYKLRQNEKDRRRIQRASFQLERLGKAKLAKDIREYSYKWGEIYDLKQSGLPTREDLQYNSELTKELDKLNDKILKG